MAAQPEAFPFSGCPQDAQNRSPGRSVVEHFAQAGSFGAARRRCTREAGTAGPATGRLLTMKANAAATIAAATTAAGTSTDDDSKPEPSSCEEAVGAGANPMISAVVRGSVFWYLMSTDSGFPASSAPSAASR